MRRSSALVTLALTGSLLSLPATAQAAPGSVTGLTGSVGDHAAVLTWSGGGSAGAVVRDVTGVPDPLTATSGTAVTSSGSTARDKAFTNLVARTYAVWAKDSDGTTSPDAGVQKVTVSPTGPVPTALSITASRTFQDYGKTFTISGQLTRAGIASPNMPVELIARNGGSSSSFRARSLVTDAAGRVSTTLVSTRTIDLYLRYVGDAFSSSSSSAHKVVSMRPTVSATLSPNVIVRPESTTFAGAVPPGLPNAAIRLQRRLSDGSWWTFATVKPDSRGRYSYKYTPGSTGKYVYRAWLPAQPAHLTGLSAPRVLEIGTRNLVLGNQGSDVLTVERALANLHYSPGKVDGVFDRNTLHAVITFQKVERIARTGKWTRTERYKMASRKGFTLRYKHTGRSVEVDVTRQVIAYVENGAIKLLVDTSTGGEYRYCYEGGCETAHTPRGNYAIQRKINGVRTSKLGYLYRPSYFVGGFALHGEAYDVPAYPASHGCVRMTDYNTDLLFDKLAVGTPVHIYD